MDRSYPKAPSSSEAEQHPDMKRDNAGRDKSCRLKGGDNFGHLYGHYLNENLDTRPRQVRSSYQS